MEPTIPQATPLRFLKWWFLVSFSKEMWASWFFILLYALIGLSWVQEGVILTKLPLQLGLLVTVAVIFGLMGTVGAVVNLRNRKRVEEETRIRMGVQTEKTKASNEERNA